MSAPIILEAAGLRVEFTRRCDRFSHRILADEAGNRVLLLESLEGTPDDDWPVSPPWQDVHCERHSGGMQVVLAVGKAGRSHWSASFELDPAGSLTVDVACRSVAVPHRLGSTYLLRGPIAIESPRAAARPIEPWILQASANDTACAIEMGDSARSLSISPIFEPAGNWPRTIRWKYSIGPASE